MGETLSNETDAPASVRRAAAHLFRVIGAEVAAVTPTRHALVEVEAVELGRGAAQGYRREGARLRIDVADGWASQLHATMTQTAGRWQIVDAGSKNGTIVNGTRVERTLLADGDVVEIGRTFFVFAAAIARGDDEPRDAGPVEALDGIATVVPSFLAALAPLRAIARGTAPVLVLGATGTGKEIVARAVHAASARKGAFVAVNCAALPAELVASTLFGHRRGAFSGAVDDEPGLVRSADGGTLLLDELGDLPASAQAMLLRVLQEREVTAVGATRAVPVDLRVVGATHRDLRAMAADGSFRDDLLHRLTGFVLELPSLAARRADIGLLIASLAARLAPGRAITLEPRAVRALLAHDWPGNIRELEQAIGAALALAGAAAVAVEHLPPTVTAPRPARAADDGQRDQLLALLTEHRGNVRAIARALGKDPVQIRRWLRRHGLDADTYR